MGLLPIEITLFLASLLGAAAFGFIRPYQGAWYVALFGIGIGAGLGFFLAPAITEWLDWNSPHQLHTVAVAVGLLGMIGCRSVVATAESEATKIVTEWIVGVIRRVLGKHAGSVSERGKDEQHEGDKE